MTFYRSLPLLLLVACFTLTTALLPLRPPATPLIVFDPYQSIWSAGNNLTDGLTTHWSGKVTNLIGILRIDNKPFVFMGRDTWSTEQAPVPPMQQTKLSVYPTQTVYQFQQNGIELTLTFSTPSLMTNIKMWSLPITYITYQVKSIDGASHNVAVFYSHTVESFDSNYGQTVLKPTFAMPSSGDPWGEESVYYAPCSPTKYEIVGFCSYLTGTWNSEVAVDDTNEEITWSRASVPGLTSLRIGSAKQNVLGQSGDGTKINWGYAYITAVASTDLKSTFGSWKSVTESFVNGASFPSDDTNKPRKCSDNWPVAALSYDFGAVSTMKSTHFMYAYDDIKSIKYFGKDLPPFWTQFATTNQMLTQSFQDYSSIVKQLTKFDQELEANLTAKGGAEYATVTCLAYRQVTGATKITARPIPTTEPWVFMKEISSDGDVSTVDVIFPASPQLIYYNLDALKWLLEPVLEYANNKTSIKYNLAWAPHHLGTWPICDLTPEKQEQMPIEETGNMFMLMAYVAKFQNNTKYLDSYWPLMKIWGDFLVSSLPDPSKQLCTDDFEGPTPHNVNLAIKGVVGLECYAMLLQMKGDAAGSDHYRSLARTFTQFILSHSDKQDHYLRQYDIPNSWSLKYNLVFDKLLNLNLFPADVIGLNRSKLPVAIDAKLTIVVYKTESAYYQTKLARYGVPLDERATFLLLEYQGAIQALTSDESHDKALNHALYNWVNEGPDRVPMSDWYDSVTGKVVGFRARPTVGDLFMKMIVKK